jgi:acyl-coenzyme A synthetase/AMP-(fatty) acid ligase
VVTRDVDGYLYFVGRRDSMIKTSGFRVSPTEVEEVALGFPGIQACVAVGLPNVEIGEDIALVYSAAADVAEPDLRQFLRRELPAHMVPRFLLSRDSLPVTGNEGKVDRGAVERALRERPP